MIKRLLLAASLLFTLSIFAQQYPFQNPGLSSEELAKDLISRLTLSGKAILMQDIPRQGILCDWKPTKFDPVALTKIYEDADARFLMIQDVHHDNYDLWNSKYQPRNSVNIGPKRDLIGEWAKACRAEGPHFGVTFHHEYTWGGGKPRLAATKLAT